MNFRNLLKYLFVALFSFTIVGCWGSNVKSTIKDAPKWFEKTPDKKGFLYSVGTGLSKDYQQSINKAKLEAKGELGDMVRSEMKANIDKVFEENMGNASGDVLDVFSSTYESTFSTLLEDWKILKKEVVREGDFFRAYVLLEWDEGKAQKRALDKIKAKKEIYDAVKANDMIQEMEDKVDKYCERYGCD